MDATSQLAFLLAYLFYEDNPPAYSKDEFAKHLNALVKAEIKEKLVLEISRKIKKGSFEKLSPEERKRCFEAIMPMLVGQAEVADVLSHYLQGNRLLEYLDYPDLPGEYGECGWMVIEGTVWERYYKR